MAMFYLIRHATNDFLGRAIAGRQSGVHLNAEGRLQAQRLGERWSTAPIQRILSSPLERCLETAAPLAARLSLQVEVSAALHELDFGEWTDKTMKWLEAQRPWQLWNEFRSGGRMPQGELMVEVQARIVAEIHRLRTSQPDDAVNALVTHGDVVRAALMYFLGMPLDFVHRLEISPGSVSVLAISDDASQVTLMNSCGD